MTVTVDSVGTGPSAEELAAFEQERPARRFSPVLDRAVSVCCALISVGVLVQVFLPIPAGTQFYLMLFLAAVLPGALLCYRGWRVPAFLNPFRRDRRGDNPPVTDWILAAVALVVSLYPLLDFDAFLERRQDPSQLD